MTDVLATVNNALALLPPKMTSDEARAMLLAIQFQEDPRQRRRQWPTGPARGLWQFERDGGVIGVLRHHSTREHALNLCWRCGWAGTVAAVYHALDRDDILAAGFARLLLWTLPMKLPAQGDVEEGWMQYLEAWRPGKERPETWEANFLRAWEIVRSDI